MAARPGRQPAEQLKRAGEAGHVTGLLLYPQRPGGRPGGLGVAARQVERERGLQVAAGVQPALTGDAELPQRALHQPERSLAVPVEQRQVGELDVQVDQPGPVAERGQQPPGLVARLGRLGEPSRRDQRHGPDQVAVRRQLVVAEAGGQVEHPRRVGEREVGAALQPQAGGRARAARGPGRRSRPGRGRRPSRATGCPRWRGHGSASSRAGRWRADAAVLSHWRRRAPRRCSGVGGGGVPGGAAKRAAERGPDVVVLAPQFPQQAGNTTAPDTANTAGRAAQAPVTETAASSSATGRLLNYWRCRGLATEGSHQGSGRPCARAGQLRRRGRALLAHGHPACGAGQRPPRARRRVAGARPGRASATTS